MCDWNNGSPPALNPLGRDRDQRLDVAVELVLRAVVGVQGDGEPYLSATTLVYSARATAPVTMSLTLVPEANSAPPVEACRMPSLPASANPCRAALTVIDDVTLMAG